MTETTTTVWAGVVRVSHVGGRAGERFHADSEQVADIERGVAAIPGARLHLLPPELDVSGGLPLERRPSLLAAVEGVESGEYAGVVVAYLSRLGRSVREQLRAWDRVEAAGGRIIVVREGIDTSTPSGRMHRTILLAIAENERETHAERFEDRTRLATAAGIWQRRQVPRGYVRDAATRRLKPGPDATAVRRAFRDRAAGVPVVEIAEDLGFTTSGVRALLRNRVYLGELKVRSYVNPEAHPAIVDREVFDAVQYSRVPRPARSHQSAALLAGLVRCQACGHALTRSRSGGSPVYMCHGRHSGGRCPAPGAVMCHLLDEYVSAAARVELAKVALTALERDAGRDALRAAVAAAEAELAAFVDAVSAADVGADVFAAGARARRRQVDEALEELRRADATSVVPPGVADAAAVWDSLGVADRRRVLGGLLDVVVVRRAGKASRIPLADRVRVVRAGSGLSLPVKRGDAPMGVSPVEWLDGRDERVLRVPLGEDLHDDAARRQ